MNALQSMHQAHKDRQVRLRAVPIKLPSALELEQQRQLHELQQRLDRQQVIISDLNAVVAKQRNIIRVFADESESPTPRIADVVAVIAEHYNLTKMIVIGAQRTSGIAHARQVGYYICRELGFAWHSIGRGFCKDHTSALHGNKQIADRIQHEPGLAEEIEIIKTAVDKYVARRIAAAKAMLA